MDLAPAVGASLEVMRRDADLMRRGRGGVAGPWLFAQVGPACPPRAEPSAAAAPAGLGLGMDEIVAHIEAALGAAGVVGRATCSKSAAVSQSV